MSDEHKRYNTRPEMGYDGGNMHGYSMHKKEGSLNKYAEEAAQVKREDEEHGTP
ncbi:hypothetical protein [Brevibacillus dissolubilis]|uniref:hypothetical protein n=1 Tax=Brevibacillus dissolubilis TaxID=1844116 RepID=UPI00159BB354|nr:hypothetical protein [Brevibacillus dissolubilis]